MCLDLVYYLEMGSDHDSKPRPARYSLLALSSKALPLVYVEYTLLGLAVVFILLIIFVQLNRVTPPKSLEAITKQKTHTIQLALERYAVDHGWLYPQSFAALLPKYLEVVPSNAFQDDDRALVKWWKRIAQSPERSVCMRNITFGDPQFEGNFTYLPWGFTNDGKAAGYYLIAYGFHEFTAQDVDGDGKGDHVILSLNSSCDCRVPFKKRPDLKELLHPQGVKTDPTAE